MHSDIITVEYKDDTLFLQILEEDIEFADELLEILDEIANKYEGKSEEEIVQKMDEYMESMGFKKIGEVEIDFEDDLR